MRFHSTRGRAPDIGFREAVLSGLAPDGGLYMPATWPQISAETRSSFASMDFAAVAATILSAFAGEELCARDLNAMAERAYDAFDVKGVAPLIALGAEDFVLELFHGPTLAFKDVAMRILAELYAWALEGAAGGKTIIGATSGDTGGAAISAFAGKANVEVFMLHPKGRISDVQRRIMTTTAADNIVNIAVAGSFDDCQRIVKSLFADQRLRERCDLGGVNSINWVRLAAQTVYYFTTLAALRGPASFVVPTGNFGDVFAGYGAMRMGAPVRRLGVAVNSNDIMMRVLRTGVYEPHGATPTSSPSMDIQVASNFERLLYEASGRDGAALHELMARFERDGAFAVPESWRAAIDALFVAESASEADVSAMIAGKYEASRMLFDPHTAVGLVALEKFRRSGEINGSAVVLATAHPAKFPDAVTAASGVRPALPSRYADLFDRAERFVEAPADAAAISALIERNSNFKKAR